MISVRHICTLLLIAGCWTSGAGCGVISRIEQKISRGILFQDTFDSPHSGWIPYSDAQGSQIIYLSEGLFARVNEPFRNLLATPGRTYADAQIQVDITRLTGEDDNLMGIICRYQNAKNYYAFLISSDGYYGIALVQEGIMKLLHGDKLSYSPDIQQGLANNRLHVSCSGTKLSLKVHGHTLAEVEDHTFRKGEVGIIVGSYASPGIEILFDNFIVSRP